VELVIIAFVVALVWGADFIVRKIRGEKERPPGLTPEGLRFFAILLLIGTIISWTVGIRQWGHGGQEIVLVVVAFILPAVATILVAATSIVRFRKRRHQGL